MDDFTECSSEIVEFPSTWKADKSKTLISTTTLTDPIPEAKNQSIQTYQSISVETQTNSPRTSSGNNGSATNEQQLSRWLNKIYPLVEAELLKGITPIYDSSITTDDTDISILPYQKISLDGIEANAQGTATWLSVKTNNAPILVVSTLSVHDDWCNHLNPTIKVFIPKRVKSQDFIAFSELKTIPVKACIKSLSTNNFDRDVFAGGTVSGDLYIWQYTTDSKNGGDISEIFCEIVEHGCIIAIAWLSEFQLLICHENGIIVLWKIAQQFIKEKEFMIPGKIAETTARLTTILSLTGTDFLIGSAEGNVFYCSINNKEITGNYTNPVVTELEKHKFSVATFHKTIFSGIEMVVSCDLSGEIYFYEMRISEDGPNLIVKMPLPFKNSIVCSKNGNFIMCPGMDGSLDIFRISNGKYYTVTGYENGKGNFIKISDNGLWIITGIYCGVFQIFKVDY